MKLFGPVHVYVPLVTVEVRLIALPSHTGELEPAVGAAGIGFTTITTVPAAEVQPSSVMVTPYVPASADVDTAIDGFCNDDEKLFGPVHVYVPLVADDVRLMASPSHTGEFDPAVGVAGIGFTVTLVVASADTQPFSVTVSEYVPASASVEAVMVGF